MIEVATTRNVERGFIHKRIGKFARKALSFAGATGIPGFSQGAQLARSFLRGGSRSRSFVEARGAQNFRARARRARLGKQAQASRFPGRNPLEVVVAAKRFGAGASDSAMFAATGDQCPKGWHLNKTGYFLKDGWFVAPMSRCVKNRRRNNDNGRAAMRAARRLLGRKRSQDAIDKALRAFAPRGRSRSKSAPAKTGTTIVQN